MTRITAYQHLEETTQAEVAQKLDVSTATISGIESGLKRFTGDLTKLGYAPHRFELPTMSEPLHRSRAATTVKHNKRAKELLRLGGEIFKELQEQTPKAPKTKIQPYPTTQIDEAAQDARHLLAVEETGPIKNLTTVIENAGVCIIPLTGLNHIDGMSSWVDGIPVIGINPNIPGDRFRLTLAHELGHLIMHSSKHDTSEHEANRFASTLLFPPDDFENAVDKHRITVTGLVSLKEFWGVSIAAMIYRAHDDGHIDSHRYRSLQIQMSRWRKNEPGEFPPLYGRLFEALVTENGGQKTVATELGINSEHLSQLLSWVSTPKLSLVK